MMFGDCIEVSVFLLKMLLKMDLMSFRTFSLGAVVFGELLVLAVLGEGMIATCRFCLGGETAGVGGI